ncbi:hypothetical protein O6H91_14G043600 [Diphasiastrum complanatum]|uniref:Uncharacterized protein n=1 Tax=Diphasiastrum complanatum TaxID=34168 RepID=A0ACC2BNU8_DIPCM|nr:hypothetical protein O6H91_14G043600 [Diphasiastrum complanatum]
MSWRCHGNTNQELVANLQRSGILTSIAATHAMLQIDRAHFVPDGGSPYEDSPQSIGHGVTISAPHMHGYCLSLLADHLKPGMSVLDIGSGSGYLAAIFSLMVGENGRSVGIELIPQLAEKSIESIRRGPASKLLESGQLAIHGPYDAIHVGAAAAELPKPLLDQLKPGGRMVIPVGTGFQDLVVIDKLLDGSIKKHVEMNVRYVPLI